MVICGTNNNYNTAVHRGRIRLQEMAPHQVVSHGVLVALVLFLSATPVIDAVRINPDLPPAQRSWDQTGNSDFIAELPFDYSAPGLGGVNLTTVKTAPGCSPYQVSLNFFGSDNAGNISVLVSWATCDAIMQSTNKSGDCTGPAKAGTVTKALSTEGLVSRVYVAIDQGNATLFKRVVEGNATSYMYNYMDYTGINYASPVLHSVLITGMIDDTVSTSTVCTPHMMHACMDKYKQVTLDLPPACAFQHTQAWREVGAMRT
jgi:hypothetical protein